MPFFGKASFLLIIMDNPSREPRAVVLNDLPGSSTNTARTPGVLNFGSAPATPGARSPASEPQALLFSHADRPIPEVVPGKTLFACEDHPAVSESISVAKRKFAALYAQEGPRIGRQIRRLLPLSLAVVSNWAEATLAQEADLAHGSAALVHRLSQLRVPEYLESVLESARSRKGFIARLLTREAPAPADEPGSELVSKRTQLDQLFQGCDDAMRQMAAVAHKLVIALASLIAVAEAAGEAPDAVLAECISHRRSLIQQAIRQAELSVLQLGELRRQLSGLSCQIATLLNITLPALKSARAKVH